MEMQKERRISDIDLSFYFFLSTFVVVAVSSAYLLSKIDIPEIAWRTILIVLLVLGIAFGISFVLELLEDLEVVAIILGFVFVAFALYRLLRYLLTFDFFVDLIKVLFIIFFTFLLLAFFSRLILELEFLLKIAPVILVSLALVFLLAQSEGLLYSSLLGVFVALGVYFVTMTKKSHTGPENMIGMSGIATADFIREESTTEYYQGRVKIGGVIWRAQSRAKILKGDPITVLEVWERLTLHVDRTIESPE